MSIASLSGGGGGVQRKLVSIHVVLCTLTVGVMYFSCALFEPYLYLVAFLLTESKKIVLLPYLCTDFLFLPSWHTWSSYGVTQPTDCALELSIGHRLEFDVQSVERKMGRLSGISGRPKSNLAFRSSGFSSVSKVTSEADRQLSCPLFDLKSCWLCWRRSCSSSARNVMLLSTAWHLWRSICSRNAFQCSQNLHCTCIYKKG
ncbi:hypothetical protein BCR44DRAFT_346361, partial [Catenaria anguillulae PL171]